MHNNVKDKMHIHAHKGIVSESIRNYFAEKLVPFDTKEQPVIQALIDLEHHRVESSIKVTLSYGNCSSLAQGKGKDPYLAMDDAVAKIDKQRKKQKVHH